MSIPQKLSAVQDQGLGLYQPDHRDAWLGQAEGSRSCFCQHSCAGMGGIPTFTASRSRQESAVLVVLVSAKPLRPCRNSTALYEVEGARPEVVDPIGCQVDTSGGVALRARDINGDGYLDVGQRPLPAAP